MNWFPRDLWQEKPVGIGYYFVDEWIGRTGYGEGYNISLGFIGEIILLSRILCLGRNIGIFIFGYYF